MDKTKRKRARRWLDPKTDSSVSYEFTHYAPRKYGSSLSCYLTFRDCSSTVTLDLEAEGKREVRARLKKVGILQGVLAEIQGLLEASLEEEWEVKKDG